MNSGVNREIMLTDDKVILRPYRKTDTFETYQAIRESLAEMSVWLPFAHREYSIRETRDWIKQRPGDWKNGVGYEFAVLDAGDRAMLGGCGLNAISYEGRRANLGYWIRSSRTGNGAAPAAARLLAEWGFRALGLKRIEIVVAVGNTRSQRVAEKTGAVREGTLRSRLMVAEKTYDAVMFSLVPSDFAIRV
jgi:ribosomal-protein-serine acetyltransferase